MSDHESLIPRTVDGALAALRETLEHERPDVSAFPRIEEPIRVLCSRAQEDGVAPEHLLVRLKRTLDVVPGLSARYSDAQAIDMRERIVSYMIDSYFSDVADRK